MCVVLLSAAVLFSFGRAIQAPFHFDDHALALDPAFPEALHSYANMLGAVGRTEDALATRRRLLALDPFVLVYHSGIPDLLWINGQTDAVISNLSVSRSAVDLTYLAKIYSAQGRQGEAVDALRAIPLGAFPEGVVQTAARVLGSTSSDAPLLQDSLRLGRRLNFVYIQAGAPERALERFEDDVAAAYAPANVMIDLWTPIYAPVRKTDRFKTYARDAGLLEYWRAKGWPELCAPTTGDDFTCH
jgi:tetratricopeptide (TPR) repeat protein